MQQWHELNCTCERQRSLSWISKLGALLLVAGAALALAGCRASAPDAQLAWDAAAWPNSRPDARAWAAASHGMRQIVADLKAKGYTEVLLVGAPELTAPSSGHGLSLRARAQRTFVRLAEKAGVQTEVVTPGQAGDRRFLTAHPADAIVKVGLADYDATPGADARARSYEVRIGLWETILDAQTGAPVAARIVDGYAPRIPPASRASSVNPADKSILALQAFIASDADQRIMTISSGLQAVPGYNTALGRQFIPHITLASWRVTPQELESAKSQFERRLHGLRALRVAVSLTEDLEGDRLNYFLLPTRTEALLQFHAQVHHRLGWRFEPFRDFDLPGQWWPQLTLFSIPADQRPAIGGALQQLGEIPAVSIERIGLVSFLGPTQVVREVKLEQPQPER